jgi:hypothetical protein
MDHPASSSWLLSFRRSTLTAWVAQLPGEQVSFSGHRLQLGENLKSRLTIKSTWLAGRDDRHGPAEPFDFMGKQIRHLGSRIANMCSKFYDTLRRRLSDLRVLSYESRR